MSEGVVINGHAFQMDGARRMCQRCGLIMHRGSEESPCHGPAILADRFRMGVISADPLLEVLAEIEFRDWEWRFGRMGDGHYLQPA